MRFTAEQYDVAIAALQDGKKQLEPDGHGCTVCGDSGHQAWECGHNPLYAMAICEAIAKASEQLHNQLHYLAGDDFYMGHRLGPAIVVVPPSGDGDAKCASTDDA